MGFNLMHILEYLLLNKKPHTDFGFLAYLADMTEHQSVVCSYQLNIWYEPKRGMGLTYITLI